MEIVKLKSRVSRIQTGDSISVPNDYFGKLFQKSLQALEILRVLGRMVEVSDGRSFSVKWDMDGQTTHGHKLEGTIQMEPKDSPVQLIPPQQTVNDFNGQDHLQQTSTAAISHAIIEEEEMTEPGIEYFLSIITSSGVQIKVMRATMFWTNPGVFVHNRPLHNRHSPEISYR